MAVTSTSYGGTFQKSSATTIVVTVISGPIPAGTLLCMAIACDNATATTPTISSITNVGGTTWTAQAGSISQSGATSTAGAGIFVYAYTCFTTASIANSTSITITLSAASGCRTAALAGWSGMTGTARGSVVANASTAGTPSAVTAGTALVAGDLVIGVMGVENSAGPSLDTDTLNGSWVASDGGSFATSGGQAATNIGLSIQHKVVTATGAQTFNPGGGANDSVAIVFSFVPTVPPSLTQAA